MFGEELVEIERGDIGGATIKGDRGYTSAGAYKSIIPVTYLGCTLHTLANAPCLNVFGPELTEIKGWDMGRPARMKIGAARRKEPTSRCNLLHTSNAPSIRSANAPGLDMFGPQSMKIEEGDMGGSKNEDRCYTSERAHNSIQHVTYLEYTLHTLANAPGLDTFGEEFMEIEGGDMEGLQKQRSVLHIRTSLQIDTTCYIPRI
jgi:hypothetical protein